MISPSIPSPQALSIPPRCNEERTYLLPNPIRNPLQQRPLVRQDLRGAALGDPLLRQVAQVARAAGDGALVEFAEDVVDVVFVEVHRSWGGVRWGGVVVVARDGIFLGKYKADDCVKMDSEVEGSAVGRVE